MCQRKFFESGCHFYDVGKKVSEYARNNHLATINHNVVAYLRSHLSSIINTMTPPDQCGAQHIKRFLIVLDDADVILEDPNVAEEFGSLLSHALTLNSGMKVIVTSCVGMSGTGIRGYVEHASLCI